MNALEDGLVSPHIFALSNSTAHTTLDTYAYDNQVGFVILWNWKDETTRHDSLDIGHVDLTMRKKIPHNTKG